MRLADVFLSESVRREVVLDDRCGYFLRHVITGIAQRANDRADPWDDGDDAPWINEKQLDLIVNRFRKIGRNWRATLSDDEIRFLIDCIKKLKSNMQLLGSDFGARTSEDVAAALWSILHVGS